MALVMAPLVRRVRCRVALHRYSRSGATPLREHEYFCADGHVKTVTPDAGFYTVVSVDSGWLPLLEINVPASAGGYDLVFKFPGGHQIPVVTKGVAGNWKGDLRKLMPESTQEFELSFRAYGALSLNYPPQARPWRRRQRRFAACQTPGSAIAAWCLHRDRAARREGGAAQKLGAATQWTELGGYDLGLERPNADLSHALGVPDTDFFSENGYGNPVERPQRCGCLRTFVKTA